MKKEYIPKFEKLNPTLSIFVFALENPKEITSLYPVYTSTNYSPEKTVIDLLYLEKEGNTHYCLIKDLISLLHHNNKHKVLVNTSL